MKEIAKAEQIIRLYSENHSVLDTAKAAGTSTVKVRKVLITEGLWESETSRKVGELLGQGLTTEEIAKQLYMSVKNVQAYMPYKRGIYGDGEPSLEAVRSERYRNRMKRVEALQVVKNNKEREVSNTMIKPNHKKNQVTNVLKLHLELEIEGLGEEEIQTLKKYGSMKQSISRDILVPADITLHALSYAILRMFGWQNGHLHCFILPENVFQDVTEEKFATWARLVGVYFRYPSEDFADLYWDDDYQEGECFRSWQKRKYTGPYLYKGLGEHYLMSQKEVANLYSDIPTIRVYGEGKEPRIIELKEATIEQAMRAFIDIVGEELLERLPLSSVIYPEHYDEQNMADIRKNLGVELSKTDITAAIEKYQNSTFANEQQRQEWLEAYNILPEPITKQLIYQYDYGAGWEVHISCTGSYQSDGNGIWNGTSSDGLDVPVESLDRVSDTYCPVCVKKDGIELVDDCSGIYGFCTMLKAIHEPESLEGERWRNKEKLLEWLDEMGWNGRKISPKQTL